MICPAQFTSFLFQQFKGFFKVFITAFFNSFLSLTSILLFYFYSEISPSIENSFSWFMVFNINLINKNLGYLYLTDFNIEFEYQSDCNLFVSAVLILRHYCAVSRIIVFLPGK